MWGNQHITGMCTRIISNFFLPLVLALFSVHSLKAQSTSNEGTEFWAVFPTHIAANLRGVRPLANYSVFITGKQASSGIVTVGSFQRRFDLLQANTVIEIQVPRNDAYINDLESNRVLSNRAIKVQVDPGKPKVVVYGHIFAGARSAASLILPKEALGQQYFSMNFSTGNPIDGGKNYIVLIASEPNTKVFLRKNGVDLVPGGVVLNNVGDVYEYLPNTAEDLTGTNVFVDPETSACKKFAMFSGTTNSRITLPGGCIVPPGESLSSDPLYQQNYPVESWGTTYGFIPFSSRSPRGATVRTRGNYVRILAKEDNTQVLYNGSLVATLKAGDYYTTPNPVNEPAYISSNNSIAVAQYSLTQVCAGGGVSDPDMVILNPIEYNIKNITVYSSSRENISEQYVNILIRTSAASTFKVNGIAPKESFTPLKSAPSFSYLQLNLNQYNSRNFNLSAADGFNAIAYGFGDVESYSYSAGTNLASSQVVAAVDPVTQKEISNACTREDFKVKLTLTSPASSLSWQLNANGPFEDQTGLTSIPVTRNGVTVYEYYFSRTVSYQTPGQKTIKVIARYTSLGGCTLNEQEIDLIFPVFDPPEAKFIRSNNFCISNEILFTDQSIDNGSPITAWHWDFGDTKTSNEQNPKHIYQNPGSYTIKLKVENETSCEGIVHSILIEIKALPVAKFSLSKPECDNPNIVFTDRSTSVQGRIVKWNWDFGDGNAAQKADASPFNYRYNAGGIYQVSLKVTSETGCESIIASQKFAMSTPFLEAGPDAIILKGGSLPFNIQASGTNLTYKWSPSTGLDRDDIKNPLASPTEDTKYTITITSEEGCVLTDEIFIRVVEKPIIPNTFTPNGDRVNDLWEIKYLDSYPDVTVNIFNRYGVKIYNSIGYIQAWNGIFNGQELPVGTYYYVIDPKIALPLFSGWVTILR